MVQTSIVVFVYGTLREHERNHHWLAGSDRLGGACYAVGRLYDTGLGYPAMTLESGGRVHGELYRVTPAVLRLLDELEDYDGEDENGAIIEDMEEIAAGGRDNEYWRVVQPIYSDASRSRIEAYVYVYPDAKAAGLTPIASGDWKRHRA